MTDKEILLSNLDKVHTTCLGIDRIKKNLAIDIDDVVTYCISIIKDLNCVITRKGKNYYCQLGNKILTVNAYSYTIITAHKKKNIEINSDLKEE